MKEMSFKFSESVTYLARVQLFGFVLCYFDLCHYV